MGRAKYLGRLGGIFDRSPVVKLSSIERIVKNRNYTKQLIRNLIKKGKIRKVAKGCYTKYEEPSLAVFCFKPAYLGMEDALSFHNLWEQETIPVVVTAAKARPGLRQIFGINVLIRRVDKKYLFGFDYYPCQEFYLPYSDVEKTLIDLVYFKQKPGKEIIRRIRKKLNLKKLDFYLGKYPPKIKNRVLKSLVLSE